MGFFSPSPSTSTTTSSSTSTFQPTAYAQQAIQNITGTASGLAAYPINNYYSGQRVADPTQLLQQYWGNAQNYGNLDPTVQPAGGTIQQLSGALYNTQMQNPQYGIGSFTPDQGTLNGIAAWGQQQFGNTPQVSAPGGVSGLASHYYVQPNQVQAPTLEQYQMGPAQQTATQSWTSPGTAQQYMSPYTQQVVNAQLAQAQTQEQQQLQQQDAQAAQAGAFGGSRQAVEAANTSIGYQQLAAQLESQGLQNAYSQGMQQFQNEQGLGLQSQMANQGAGLTVGAQNLAANLQTQGLGAQLNMQGQLANQAAGIQTGLAAQQMGLQGALSNAQMGLQAQEANQAAYLQGAGLQYQGGVGAAEQQQQLGLQGQIQGAQMGLSQQQLDANTIAQAAGLQNTAANLGLQGYYAGLQGQNTLAQAANSQQGYQQSLNDAQLAQWLQNVELPMQAEGWNAGIQSLFNSLTPTYSTSSGTSTTTGIPAQQSVLGQILGLGIGAAGAFGNLFGLAKGGAVKKVTGIERYKNSPYRSRGHYRKGLGHYAKAA